MSPSDDTPRLPLHYYVSKSRTLLMLAGALGFVALGYYLISHTQEIAVSSHRNPYEILIVGYLCMAFFGLMIPIAVYRLMRHILIFQIDERGITIDMDANRPGTLIAWRDIDSIRLIEQKVRRTSVIHLGVFLKNNTPYYDTLTPIREKLARLRENMLGTPVTLDTHSVRVDRKKLVAWLDIYRARFA